jgi:signal transduction histidine kinase
MLSITHELKSPIASMRLILETFSKHELSRDQREKLAGDGIRDATRLQNLVESLLLAARLEDNWRPLIEPVDLASLVRDITASLLVRFANARFQVNIPADMPPVQADKTGLTSVLQNLLENAVKYAPQGAPVVLTVERKDGKVRLQVADQGQGIPESEKKAVFEKFYRLGNADRPNTSGTGLGLYIVDQVVKAHGGTIVVTDNKPTGTIFTIEF